MKGEREVMEKKKYRKTQEKQVISQGKKVKKKGRGKIVGKGKEMKEKSRIKETTGSSNFKGADHPPPVSRVGEGTLPTFTTLHRPREPFLFQGLCWEDNKGLPIVQGQNQDSSPENPEIA